MRYLKSFNESIVRDGYEEIQNFNRVINADGRELISNQYYNTIVNTLSELDVVISQKSNYGNYIEFFTSSETNFYYPGADPVKILYEEEVQYLIYKYDDEWWYLVVNYDTGRSCGYKCDQIDGVIKCIKEILI